jgi:hypothetical protein
MEACWALFPLLLRSLPFVAAGTSVGGGEDEEEGEEGGARASRYRESDRFSVATQRREPSGLMATGNWKEGREGGREGGRGW